MQRNQIVPAFRLLLTVAATMCALTMAPHPASAHYDYAYGVNDPNTGDIKDQQESRDGDQVTGYYRLLDADGLVRTVNYMSNPRTGYLAQVTRERQGPDMARSAIPAEATSYQQHLRPMSGYRYDITHPTPLSSAYNMAAGAALPIAPTYGEDFGQPAYGYEKK